MFQQSAHEAVVHAFGRGGLAESGNKVRVFHKERLQQLFQPRVFQSRDIAQKFLVHPVIVKPAHRKVVGRIVFPFPAQAHALDIDLQRPLEAGHIPVHFYVVQAVEVVDPRAVGIPDFGIQGAGAVLQDHRVIGFPVFRHCGLFVFAQVNVEYPVSFFVVL